MAGNPIVRKLLIKPGQRVAFVNAPPGYPDRLGALPDGVEVASRLSGRLDLVQVFVRSVKDLERLAPKAMRAMKPDGLLWIAYPKRSAKVDTDITRDRGWDVMSRAGWRPVTQIAIDAVWSALRFRPVDRVGR